MSPNENDSGLIILDDEYHCFNIKKDLEVCPNDMVNRIKDKLTEVAEDELFKSKTVILKLILAHEYTFEENAEKALEYLNDLEEEVEVLKETGCDEYFFKSVHQAFINIVRTCQMYVFIKISDSKSARAIMPSIISYSDLDDANKASVHGIRSMIFMEYGLYGHKMALEYAKKANKMDKENPYWFFLIGKSLGRIRRVEKPYDIPSDEERNALESAIRKEPCCLFMLFTAEVYVETSTRTYRFHQKNHSLYSTLKVKIDQLNENASNLYKKCIEIQPKCSHVLFRSARGLLNLPHPQKDPERAKELLIRGLEPNPRNPFANHLLARYYERYAQNIPEAIKRLEICREQRVFGAEMDLLRLQFAREGNTGVIDRLYELIDIFAEVPRKLNILTQIASYYIFIESDIPKACKLIKEAVTLSCDDNITNHRSLFLKVREPFSILDVLVDEMKMEMEKGCDDEKKKLYESFIFDMNDSNIKIPKGRAKDLKDEILKEHEAAKLGNYYKRQKNPNEYSQMMRRSYPKPVPKSEKERSSEKSHTFRKVDDFFDSYMDGSKQNENKRYQNGSTYRNNSSRNSSISDLSPGSDSRFASTRGRYDRNRNNDNRHPRHNTSVDELDFDRLSSSSKSSREPANYSRSKNNGDDLERDFDRLSVSSRNSDNRFGSKPNRGRGRTLSNSGRQFQERGDFERNNVGRGRGRPSNAGTDGSSYDNRSNYDSKFSRGRSSNASANHRQPERENKTNDNSKFSRDRPANPNGPYRPSESPGNSWRQQNVPNRSDKPAERDFPKGKNEPDRSYKPKAPPKAVQNDSDSDEDLMSYFKKK
ncbi:uncharacterized protein LOC135846506 [Planococcus citri]|uniref:uncharacterized protein LOC135846506 n=1 Tax=Planococcus citri TaxID=170843 RepID=UPI0031F7DA86